LKNASFFDELTSFVFQSHGDEVVDIPSFMTNYGTSESCKIELCISNDERFFTIQGHPEFTEEFLAIVGKKTKLEKYFKMIDESLQGQDNLLRYACFSFLHVNI